MRAFLIAAAVLTASCTPRNNLDDDLELERAPEEAVHAEPTVVGGAYDSIIYRWEVEEGIVRTKSAHPAAPAAEPAH